MVQLQTPLRTDEELSFVFPDDICANCGTTERVARIEQDTRVTRYLLGGGTELTFALPIGLCGDCMDTSTKRPISVFGWLIRFALFASILACLLIGVMMVADIPALADHTLWLAACGAVILVVLMMMRKRPAPGQTSYFQPVRVTGTKRDFVSGTVRSIRFGFTNPDYERRFQHLNADVIRQGLVDATVL